MCFLSVVFYNQAKNNNQSDRNMRTSLLSLALCCLTIGASTVVHASEFDLYLRQEKILDANFKIIDHAQLNELLIFLSAEDSKTLPYQIDQNTIIEKLTLQADNTQLHGLITTPDFAQFEQAFGEKEVTKMIRQNLIHHCGIFFEHEYQRQNPYHVELQLSSTTNSYKIDIQQKDCYF